MAVDDVRKEQIKLRATYLNGLATGLFTSGVITPAIAVVLNPETSHWQLVAAAPISFGFLALSVFSHMKAVETLKGLE